MDRLYHLEIGNEDWLTPRALCGYYLAAGQVYAPQSAELRSAGARFQVDWTLHSRACGKPSLSGWKQSPS